MAIERIQWSKVVGETQTIDDGGFTGDLLSIARAHIDNAQGKGKLTQSQAGAIYTQMIPAAFQQAINYSLGKAQGEIDIKTKEDTLEWQKLKTLAELRKNWGVDIQQNIDGELYVGTGTVVGKVDEEIAASIARTSQLAGALTEKVTMGAKQRLLLDKQIATEGENKRVKEKQVAAFGDAKKQKLFEAGMNAWALMYSSGRLDAVPSFISNNQLSTLYNTLD